MGFTSVQPILRLNDSHRRTRAGKGTFRATMRGIDLLRVAGVHISILAVLTRESLRHIDEVFDFFEAEGIRQVAFNLEEIKGHNSSRSFETNDDILNLYRDFARKALIRQSGGSLDIREISATEQRLGSHPVTTIGSVKPLQFVTVGVDGGFSTYCPELHGFNYPNGTRHIFGNVLRNEFLDIMANREFLSLYTAVMEGVVKCACTCDRFSICGSHRVAVKYFENGTFSSSETVHCKSRIKAVAELIEANKSGGASPYDGLNEARRSP